MLLDTPVLIWAVDDSKRLSRRAVSEIPRARRGGGLAVSAISLWELASLFARGRIQAYGTIEASVRLLIEDVTVRPITSEIAALVSFPPISRVTPPTASSVPPLAPKV
jgi:PIN domain nuclease of toxin-antitoxin system